MTQNFSYCIIKLAKYKPSPSNASAAASNCCCTVFLTSHTDQEDDMLLLVEINLASPHWHGIILMKRQLKGVVSRSTRWTCPSRPPCVILSTSGHTPPLLSTSGHTPPLQLTCLSSCRYTTPIQLTCLSSCRHTPPLVQI